MKTSIAEQEWQKLTEEKAECSLRELTSNVAARFRDEADLKGHADDYLSEIAHLECEALIESKVKTLDNAQLSRSHIEWVQQELKSGHTVFGQGEERFIIRNDKLTHRHLTAILAQHLKQATRGMES
jgi:hypothetical protein